MKEYMIALRGSHKEWSEHSPAEIQKIMEQYNSWVVGLKKSGVFKYGLPLTEKAKLIRGAGHQSAIVDGPYSESKEALTGFFVIEAGSLDDAIKIARECPALSHGEAVEVIEAGEH